MPERQLAVHLLDLRVQLEAQLRTLAKAQHQVERMQFEAPHERRASLVMVIKGLDDILAASEVTRQLANEATVSARAFEERMKREQAT